MLFNVTTSVLEIEPKISAHYLIDHTQNNRLFSIIGLFSIFENEVDLDLDLDLDLDRTESSRFVRSRLFYLFDISTTIALSIISASIAVVVIAMCVYARVHCVPSVKCPKEERREAVGDTR